MLFISDSKTFDITYQSTQKRRDKSVDYGTDSDESIDLTKMKIVRIANQKIFKDSSNWLSITTKTVVMSQSIIFCSVLFVTFSKLHSQSSMFFQDWRGGGCSEIDLGCKAMRNMYGFLFL